MSSHPHLAQVTTHSTGVEVEAEAVGTEKEEHPHPHQMVVEPASG